MLQLVISDLDGTLIDHHHSFTETDLETFRELGRRGITRAIATGRNLFSLRNELPDDFPIDYLIFSTGVGILNWHTKELIFSDKMDAKVSNNIAEILVEQKVDFFIYEQAPQNHVGKYFTVNADNDDFFHRLLRYQEFSIPFEIDNHDYCNVSQFLCILPNVLERFNHVREKVNDIPTTIIRATSPLDKQSIWLEFYPSSVSKGKAVEWLCNYLNINQKHTFGIGNDYNDEDFLQFVEHAFVVENAPEELKKQFQITEISENSGFSKAVEKIIEN